MSSIIRNSKGQFVKGIIGCNKGKKGPPCPWKGKKLNEDWKKNLSKAHIGQKAWNKGLKCPPQSRETLIKRSESMKRTLKENPNSYLFKKGERHSIATEFKKGENIGEKSLQLRQN